MENPGATGRGRRRATAVSAWLRLARVFQKVERALSMHLRRWNVSSAQFDVLAHVGAAQGITQQELADALLITKGNVCQLLDRLEEGGLVMRRQEGRTNRLFLTERGRTLFAEVIPAHEALVAERFSALSPTEQIELLGLLRRVDRALGRRAVGRAASSPRRVEEIKHQQGEAPE